MPALNGFRSVLGAPLSSGAELHGVRRYKPRPIFEATKPTAPERHPRGAGGFVMSRGYENLGAGGERGVIVGGDETKKWLQRSR